MRWLVGNAEGEGRSYEIAAFAYCFESAAAAAVLGR